MKINRDTLADFLEAAVFYGDPTLFSVTAPKAIRKADPNEPVKHLKRHERYLRIADHLLEGGQIEIFNESAFEAGWPDEKCRKFYKLSRLKSGFKRAQKVVPEHWADVEAGKGKNGSANVVLQVVFFFKVITDCRD